MENNIITLHLSCKQPITLQINNSDTELSLFNFLKQYHYIDTNTDTDTDTDTNTPTQNAYFILSGSKPISRYETIKSLIKKGYKNFDIFPVLKGGGLIDMFMGIIKMGEFFLIIPDIILWLLKTVVWIVQFIPWVLKTFLNPSTIAHDIVGALMTIMIAVLMVPIDLFLAFTQYGTNIVGTMMASIWGWDQANLTAVDKQSAYFKDSKNCRDKKCYLSQSNTVPFSVLLGTIICPPLGVFMVYGLTGWFNILICLGLTMIFYFPGLIYALLIVYN